ncbi:efflux RND transporter periplasmic adaptor subunit [Sulfurospirillum arcachonense]|uniref:efflux RND transporter periplasmic adaptor subunit n=1 Tax=Sulfurospirillum arcachonense TaxID=57666 RepID=UPI000469E776|nr:efflux RND transporter periplasmic adaptor subunit [Sulfurospirillum arcachonense]
MFKNKKFWLIISGSILSFVIVTVISMENTTDITKKEKHTYTKQVTIANITPTSHQSYVQSFAIIQPRWSAKIKSQVDGEIIEVSPNALEGNWVSKDDALAQIDPKRYQAELDEAKQLLSQMQLELKLEQEKTKQIQADWSRSGIKESPSDISMNIPQLKAIEDKVAYAKSKMLYQENMLKHTTIQAPFSGYITIRQISPGQKILEGEELFEIIDNNHLDIHVSLGEQQWNLLDKSIWKKQAANIVNENDELLAQANIVRGGGYLDSKTHQYTLFLEVIQNQVNHSLSGQFVHVQIPGKILDNVLQIPQSALTQEGNVWYIDKKNQLQKYATQALFYKGEWAYVYPPKELKEDTIKIAINPLSSFLIGTVVKEVKH